MAPTIGPANPQETLNQNLAANTTANSDTNEILKTQAEHIGNVDAKTNAMLGAMDKYQAPQVDRIKTIDDIGSNAYQEAAKRIGTTENFTEESHNNINKEIEAARERTIKANTEMMAANAAQLTQDNARAG